MGRLGLGGLLWGRWGWDGGWGGVICGKGGVGRVEWVGCWKGWWDGLDGGV